MKTDSDTWLRGIVRVIVMFVAASVGIAACAGYIYWFRADLDFNIPANMEDVPWTPARRRFFEGLVVLWSVASLSGQGMYRIVGTTEDIRTVRDQIGGYVLFLQLFGSILLAVSLAFTFIAGQGLQLKDLLTLAVSIFLFVAALLQIIFTNDKEKWDDVWNQRGFH